MHAWFQTRFNWRNTQYRETVVLSGDFWLCINPILPHFAFLSHIISYNEYIVILFRSKECEDLFLFKCFLNWTIRYMKGIIMRITITEITCRYHDNQNNVACTSCSETKLPGWKTPQLFTFFEKRLVLKVVSLDNNETFDSIRDEIFSWCYQSFFQGTPGLKLWERWESFQAAIPWPCAKLG